MSAQWTDAKATTLRSRLIETGYAILPQSDYADFQASIDTLGRTIETTEIQVDETRRAKLASSKEMSLHTDSPEARWIAWYCAQQSDGGGESVLVDFHDVCNLLPPDVVQRLRSVEVVWPDFAQKLYNRTWPLLEHTGVYFADWLVRRPDSRQMADALDRFTDALANSRRIIHRLAKGEALIIDNRRMFHGRCEIRELQQKRLLIRHWISDRTADQPNNK